MLSKALRDVGAFELGQPHSKRLYVVPSIGDHTDLVRKREEEEEEEERERVGAERRGKKEERVLYNWNKLIYLIMIFIKFSLSIVPLLLIYSKLLKAYAGSKQQMLSLPPILHVTTRHSQVF